MLRPERKGLRVLAACGGATRESRLTREEAAGPRKASGVLQSFRSLQDSARESARLVRSKLFAPSCLVLGNRSPKGSSSGAGETRCVSHPWDADSDVMLCPHPPPGHLAAHLARLQPLCSRAEAAAPREAAGIGDGGAHRDRCYPLGCGAPEGHGTGGCTWGRALATPARSHAQMQEQLLAGHGAASPPEAGTEKRPRLFKSAPARVPGAYPRGCWTWPRRAAVNAPAPAAQPPREVLQTGRKRPPLQRG